MRTSVRLGILRPSVFLAACSMLVGILGSTGAIAAPQTLAPHAVVESRAAVTVWPDVPYRTIGDVELTLDVYAPADPGPFPAVLVIHGGYWKIGDKADWAGEAQALADNGLVAFVANYRLDCSAASPPPGVDPALCGYHAPDPIDDLLAAMSWIRTNASAYGAIPTEVAAFGGSAGGNLALMLGATGTVGDTRPDVVASWSGNTEIWRYDLAKDPVHAEAVARRYVGCPYEGPGACPSQWYDASPITFVSADDPPTYIANGTRETIPLQEARDLDAALRSAGVEDFLRVIRGSRHERQYENVVISLDGTTVLGETISFLLAHLS
jgi:acetyl esterase/lipase